MESLIIFIGNSTSRKLLKFSIKWNRYWQVFLTCVDIKDPEDHIFCDERRGTMNCVWTLIYLHFTSISHVSREYHQSLQWNVCATHVNDFSSNVVEYVDFSDLSGSTVGWFISFSEIK